MLLWTMMGRVETKEREGSAKEGWDESGEAREIKQAVVALTAFVLLLHRLCTGGESCQRLASQTNKDTLV